MDRPSGRPFSFNLGKLVATRAGAERTERNINPVAWRVNRLHMDAPQRAIQSARSIWALSRHGNVRQLHYPPRWVLIPALVWGTFPVGLRRDRQLRKKGDLRSRIRAIVSTVQGRRPPQTLLPDSPMWRRRVSRRAKMLSSASRTSHDISAKWRPSPSYRPMSRRTRPSICIV